MLVNEKRRIAKAISIFSLMLTHQGNLIKFSVTGSENPFKNYIRDATIFRLHEGKTKLRGFIR